MAETCGALIKQLNDKLQRDANRGLEGSQVTITQVAVLTELERRPGRTMTMKEVERFLQIAQSTTVGILSRLHKKGYISVRTSTKDKRVKEVRLTEKGAMLCGEGRKHMRETDEKLLSPLDDGERQQFLGLLGRICKAYD